MKNEQKIFCSFFLKKKPIGVYIMKLDRLLFTGACLGLGMMTYSSLNKDDKMIEPQVEYSSNIPQMKPQLSQDTIQFLEKDSTKIIQDSLQIGKKVLK
jgi:hypothetical protein